MNQQIVIDRSTEVRKAFIEKACKDYNVDSRELNYLLERAEAYAKNYFSTPRDARNPVLNGSGGYGGKLSPAGQKERAAFFGAMGQVFRKLEKQEA